MKYQLMNYSGITVLDQLYSRKVRLFEDHVHARIAPDFHVIIVTHYLPHELKLRCIADLIQQRLDLYSLCVGIFDDTICCLCRGIAFHELAKDNIIHSKGGCKIQIFYNGG